MHIAITNFFYGVREITSFNDCSIFAGRMKIAIPAKAETTAKSNLRNGITFDLFGDENRPWLRISFHVSDGDVVLVDNLQKKFSSITFFSPKLHPVRQQTNVKHVNTANRRFIR